MQNYSSNVTDSAGNAVAYALITIFNADGTLATLYSNSTGTASLPNPFPADALGRFNFFAANGKYKGTYAGNGILGFSFQFELFDPTDSTAAASIGNGGETVADSLNALQLADYTALRAYAGPRKSVYVTGYLGTAAPSGIAGMFVRDDHDTTTADNGGTVIAATNGVRWKRAYQGEALPEWFGALGSGHDDTTAVQAAMNTGRYKLAQQYSITATVTPPASSRGCGPGSLIKAANCDMVSLSDGAQMSGISLVGIGQLYTGRGVVISGGSDQRLLNCDMTGMSGYCVEYSASQAGLRGTIQGGKYQRQDSTQAAIKYPDSETNGDRRLLNVDCAGGVLCSLAGSATTMIGGCDTVGVVFAAGTQKAVLTGNRIATMGGTLNVQGVDCIIEGNCIAGSVILVSGSTNCTIGRNTLAANYAVQDQSGNCTNYVDSLGEDIAPTWTASGAAPSIGNGSLTGRLRRSGKRVSIDIHLNFGSTTTFGSGFYSFALPTAFNNYAVKTEATGAALALKSGVAFHTGVVTTPGSGSAPLFSIYSENGGSQWGAAVPVTWAAGDYLRFSIEFEIG